MPRTKFGSDIMLNVIIISNVMCYTILCMLEWMQKGKYRIEGLHLYYVRGSITPRIQGLRDSALMAYIHREIP